MEEFGRGEKRGNSILEVSCIQGRPEKENTKTFVLAAAGKLEGKGGRRKEGRTFCASPPPFFGRFNFDVLSRPHRICSGPSTFFFPLSSHCCEWFGIPIGCALLVLVSATGGGGELKGECKVTVPLFFSGFSSSFTLLTLYLFFL